MRNMLSGWLKVVFSSQQFKVSIRLEKLVDILTVASREETLYLDH